MPGMTIIFTSKREADAQALRHQTDYGARIFGHTAVGQTDESTIDTSGRAVPMDGDLTGSGGYSAADMPLAI